MRVDLRVKHDVEARKAAIGLFELGHGYKSAAIALSLPLEAVRRWQEIYRAFGSEVLLRMDGKQGRYTYEQKVVDGSMTKTEAMAAFGILSMSPLKKWCALYRRGGAEALRPRPKDRPIAISWLMETTPIRRSRRVPFASPSLPAKRI